MSKYHWLLVGVMLGLFLLICFSGCTSSFNKLNSGQVIPLPNDEYGIVIDTPLGVDCTYTVLTSDGEKVIHKDDIETFDVTRERHFDFDSGWIYEYIPNPPEPAPAL